MQESSYKYGIFLSYHSFNAKRQPPYAYVKATATFLCHSHMIGTPILMYLRKYTYLQWNVDADYPSGILFFSF